MSWGQFWTNDGTASVIWCESFVLLLWFDSWDIKSHMAMLNPKDWPSAENQEPFYS